MEQARPRRSVELSDGFVDGKSFEPWNTFGFAVIDLVGRDMHVWYIDESGTLHHQEHLYGRPSSPPQWRFTDQANTLFDALTAAVVVSDHTGLRRISVLSDSLRGRSKTTR